jgi:hypothetical protein
MSTLCKEQFEEERNCLTPLAVTLTGKNQPKGCPVFFTLH